MLVDNAIVIMDGIIVDRNRGLAPKKYLFNIGKKTAFPLLGATIIAAASLLCIFLSKTRRESMQETFSWVLAISLLLSWVSCFGSGSHFRKDIFACQNKAKYTRRIKDNKMQHAIRTCVQWLIAHRTLSVSVFCGVLLLSIFGMTKVKICFSRILIIISMLLSTSLPPSDRSCQGKKKTLNLHLRYAHEKMGEVKSVVATMGGPVGRYS